MAHPKAPHPGTGPGKGPLTGLVCIGPESELTWGETPFLWASVKDNQRQLFNDERSYDKSSTFKRNFHNMVEIMCFVTIFTRRKLDNNFHICYHLYR